MIAADRWVFAAIVPASQQALFAGPEYLTIGWLAGLSGHLAAYGALLPLF